MTKSINNHEQGWAKARSRQNQQPPEAFDELCRKNGYFDGKIFIAPEKATFTFVTKNEVMILHLDIEKQALYLNGHKIEALNAHPDLPDFLTQFKKCLLENTKTQDFTKSFDCIVSNLCDIS